MFENLQLIDADGKSWIEYNKDTKAWEAVTVGNGKTAYDVFQAKPEAAKNTAGIIKNDDVFNMLKNAKLGIKDWKAASKLNPSKSKGEALP